jgi:hypothetical protein
VSLAAGQKRDHGLGDHGQVHGHPVVLYHAEGLERICGLLHLFGQLHVGLGAGLTGFTFDVDGPPAAPAGLDMPVRRVVGGVDSRPRTTWRMAGWTSHVPGQSLAPGQQLTRLLAQKAGRSAAASSYSDALTTASAANSGVGGKVRVSCSRFSKASPCSSVDAVLVLC